MKYIRFTYKNDLLKIFYLKDGEQTEKLFTKEWLMTMLRMKRHCVVNDLKGVFHARNLSFKLIIEGDGNARPVVLNMKKYL